MFSFVKNFFILIIFLFLTSCHEKDYNIFKDFIMKDQQTENLKKPDTLETDKIARDNTEKQAVNLEKINSEKKKLDRVDKDQENKELKFDKNISRVLEDLENQKKKY